MYSQNNNMKPTKEIKKALEHVQSVFPEVSIVIFTTDGRWCYMTEDFGTPNFNISSVIDQSILEDAADSVEQLPFIYHDTKNAWWSEKNLLG